MGKMFGGSTPKPKADPELERMKQAEQARVAKEKADEEQRKKDEEAAKLRRLRGQRSLLGGSETGYGLGGGTGVG